VRARLGLWLALAVAAAGPLASAGHAQDDVVVRALRGLAVGGDVTGSTFTVGISGEQLPVIIAAVTGPLERLNNAQRATIDELGDRLDASQGQLLAFFRIIGEAGVPPDHMGDKLIEVAQHYHAAPRWTGPMICSPRPLHGQHVAEAPMCRNSDMRITVVFRFRQR
jgi:hypothetical protein